MWTRTFSKIYTNVGKEEIWKLWSNVNNWNLWDPDIEYARMEGPFAVGSIFYLKPKGAAEVMLEIVEVEYLKKYTDTHKFWGAQLFGTHEMEETPEGLRLTCTIKVTGILKYLWIKLVVQSIVDTLEEQCDALVKLAQTKKTKHG